MASKFLMSHPFLNHSLKLFITQSPSYSTNRKISTFLIEFQREDLNFTNTSINIDGDLYDGQPYPPIPENYVVIFQIMDDYILPVVMLLGILGNTLSLIVYVSTPRLCRQTSSVYLAFLSGVDNAYLLFYCMVWFNFIGINIYHQNGWCQIIFYSMYVCNFLAAWTVVSFTGERWIILFRPILKSLCTRKRAFKNMVLLTILALLLYSYSLLTVYVEDQYPDKPVCMVSIKNESLSLAIKTSNIIITILIPLVAIVTMNASIVIKISRYNRFQRESESKAFHLLTMDGLSSNFTCSNDHHASRSQYKERATGYCERGSENQKVKCFSKQELPSSTNGVLQKRHASSNSSARSPPPMAPQYSTLHPSIHQGINKQEIKTNISVHHHSLNSPAQRCHVTTKADDKTSQISPIIVIPQPINRKSHSNLMLKTKRHHTQLHITRSLLLVSSVFVILNLPSYAFHVCGLVMSIWKKNVLWNDSSYPFLWDHFVQFVYCSNFSSRFFLYIGCSQHFRFALKRLACLFKARKKRIGVPNRRR